VNSQLIIIHSKLINVNNELIIIHRKINYYSS